MGRAPCCDKANVKKGPWSPEEDFKLKSYIHNHGTGSNWIALPQKIGLKRCGKSCRLRWLNYLRPNIKHGSFTEEEDNIICSLYISIGSRWSIIAAQLPGRTDNDIKNYWNTRLKKKLLGRHRKSSSSPISGQGDVGAFDLNSLSSSALERLQLHMQLQTPLSLYDINPASFWPKLNHLQQRMIETLHSLNQNQLSSSSSASASAPPPLGPDYTVDRSSGSQVPPQFNSIRDSDSIGFALQQSIDAKPCSFVNLQAVGDELDCFKEMEGGGAKENVAWWCNAFEASSWESTAVIRRSEEINGDYDMGFRI